MNDPSSQTAELKYEASVKDTEQLTNLILDQTVSLETLDHSKIERLKDDLRIAKSVRYSSEFKMLSQTLSLLTQRAITAEKEKGVSSWKTHERCMC